MTRAQRRWHTWLWFALGPLVVGGLILAVSARPALATRSQRPILAPAVGGVESGETSQPVEARP